MRVLVTGASGFIGHHVVDELSTRGHDVDAPGLGSPRLELADRLAVEAHLVDHPAEALVHGAWLSGMDRATSSENVSWVAITATLIESFLRYGGRRVVTMGTCFEYEFVTPLLIAGVTPIRPHTIYGATKASVADLVGHLDRLGVVSGAHARIGYVYGPGEKPPRLVPGLVAALASGQRYKTSPGTQKRDYLHVADVATGLATLLESGLRGPVNIGSGLAISVRELAEALSAVVGRPDLVDFGALERRPGDPDEIILDVDSLRSLGWEPRMPLEAGVADTVKKMLPAP